MICLIPLKETQEDGTIDPKIRYIDLRKVPATLVCVMCSPMIAVVGSKTGKLLSRSQNKNLKATQGWDNKG